MVEQAERPTHHEEMTALEEIIEAHRAIDAARQHYYALLRKKLKVREVKQSDVAKALNVTRETIRRDAMTDEERGEVRRADAERRRNARSGTRPASGN